MGESCKGIHGKKYWIFNEAVAGFRRFVSLKIIYKKRAGIGQVSQGIAKKRIPQENSSKNPLISFGDPDHLFDRHGYP